MARNIVWHTFILLLAACVSANGPSGILEVDMVFPRNETYAPQERFPVVFAIQNSELASLVRPSISISIRDLNNLSAPLTFGHQDELKWVNYTDSDPYFTWNYFGILSTEGYWSLRWEVVHITCTNTTAVYNRTGYQTIFTTQRGAQAIDLVTTPNKTCDKYNGVAVNVTQTLSVPLFHGGDWGDSKTCPTIAPIWPIPNACQVDLDDRTAASITSAIDLQWCKATSSASECGEAEKKNTAAKRFGAGGLMVTLAVIFISVL